MASSEVMDLLVQLVGQLAEARQERDEERRRCADLLAANQTHQQTERDALRLADQARAVANDLQLDVNRLERQKAVLEIEVEGFKAALVEARAEVARLRCVVAYHERCPPLKGA